NQESRLPPGSDFRRWVWITIAPFVTVIAWIGEHEIKAPLTGMVRGLLNDGLAVVGGFKIGDIDPRGETADFTSVSDKARAIGGGVLEALMMLMHQGVKATKEVLEVA
ncbi:hypothetical protein ABMZ15_21350, partial [Escherichia coli]